MNMPPPIPETAARPVAVVLITVVASVVIVFFTVWIVAAPYVEGIMEREIKRIRFERIASLTEIENALIGISRRLILVERHGRQQTKQLDDLLDSSRAAESAIREIIAVQSAMPN